MKYTGILALFVTSALLTGCAAGSGGTRSRTAAPAGPAATGSTSDTVIPAGTTIAIRANETIDSKTADAGRKYAAELAQDIVNANGEVIAPRGSDASLVVIDASTGGAVGTSEVELALSTLTIHGRNYNVQTDVVGEQGAAGIGANERTARNVGGGAALGAVIGAIAGGGSGAAAGAAIGAAAGGVAQVLTRGDAVRVPAETVMTFRIERPITLR